MITTIVAGDGRPAAEALSPEPPARRYFRMAKAHLRSTDARLFLTLTRDEAAAIVTLSETQVRTVLALRGLAKTMRTALEGTR